MPYSSITDDKPCNESQGSTDAEQQPDHVPTAGVRASRRRRSMSGAYDTWTVVELKKRAKEFGLSGYSSLNKEDLIDHLRRH